MQQAFWNATLKQLTALDKSGPQWLADMAEKAHEEKLDKLATELGKGGGQSAFLSTVMTLSPFLRETFIRNPAFIEPLLHEDISVRLQHVLDEIDGVDNEENITEAGLMAALRRKKLEAHVLIALADLGGLFTAAMTSEWLTRLAEATLKAALRFLLRDAHAQGKINLADFQHPEQDCGLVVLGMGKLGARELNYSSDIDLIVFIDEMSPHIGDQYESIDVFSKMMRRLIRIMQERTADGYVFRVDLRLRPDPGSTPLALPISAALHYYESRGQNWERAAMIKARPVAGDIKAGEAVLHELAPYIWRKYLDYAAIADIHSIKRQIHAYKGHGEIAVRGHNVKLGRGGIREIEFFVQTQQLIAGGRFPELRGRRTVDMLAELCALGWINAETRDVLTEKYVFLRNVEHRIQMLEDEQTHILPEDDQGFASVAYMMGYQDIKQFTHDFRNALTTVEHHYAALFEQEKELGSETGNLVFTGEDDDPGTLATLSKMGFSRPSDICRIIRTWHFGRYHATQSAEARERLTELTPALLKAFGATKKADEALSRFDTFLQGLPSGIQLFSLLQSNPSLLDMLVLIMSSAPRLAEIITRKPHIFDGMLDPAIFAELPTKTYLENRLEFFLSGVFNYEDILDQLRLFANEQRFLIGIRLLNGAIEGERAARAFTDLADLMISKALSAVEEEFGRVHGFVKGGRVGILGMGKLGSHELTAGSDVDLILLYDYDKNTEMSDGEKPLYISQYYTRLTQRLIAALSAPTGEGVLYEVDLRLRPSGNKGPVAVPFEAFGKYQRNEAWVWEHLALTRARAIAGDQMFLQQLEDEVAAIIALKRDRKSVVHDVREMRALIEKEKPPLNIWDFKTMRGGQVDLEFITQFSLICHQSEFVIGRTTGEVLERLPQSFLDISSVGELHHAYRIYTNLSQMMRLCLNDKLDPVDMPPGLADLLQRTVGEPDLGHVESLIAEMANSVGTLFDQVIV
ncbi:bifunctional [glutamine synthetase] adenylyltransferase/[glutamine synthetase]-adenylyl-L-tyrosine phosphorylase [uncultured Bartonella sp.]|uniref:bifunctional [glutamine synthetase] adenylyltransferase/[glutamine synthetase]-adenylyl-L-tyrosine phosphorylase n=1 Tax=uncultured Bartonella sp. TaxID=104108 RepID=UPI0025D22EB2|nr:bifunctional [glutamine synthetase] adenylyltransferase/[glutamine synthetase]-adenylyl-L-tyrosine phosphorylase [uncultured Bartonella sp.]